MPAVISRKRVSELTFQFLPIEKQIEEINLLLAFDPSLHPKDKSGKWAPKGAGVAGKQNRPGRTGKNKTRETAQTRYNIESGQTAAEAYGLAKKSAKEKREQKRLERQGKKQKYANNLDHWKNIAREQENQDKAAQAKEIYDEIGGEEGLAKALSKSAVKEGAAAGATIVGGHIVSRLGNNFANKFRKLFGKKAVKENIVDAELVHPDYAGKTTNDAINGFNKRQAAKAAAGGFDRAKAAKSMKGIYREALNQGADRTTAKTAARSLVYKKVISQSAHKAFVNETAQAVAGAATAQAGTSIALKAVGASRFWSAAKAVGMVGGALLQPQIAIPLSIAAAGAYFAHRVHQKKQQEAENMARERELMRQEAESPKRALAEERQWHKDLREQTAKEVARQASIYATKRYAAQEMKEKTAAIDEELGTKRVQKKQKKSARITAYAAAKEYGKKERRSAYQQRESDSYLYNLT